MKARIATALLGLVLCACGSGTGQERVAFDVEVSAHGGRGATNAHGYEIRLSEARIHFGTLQFFEGEPLFSALIRRLFTIPSAHAHPGHYMPGETLADLLETRSFDLLAPEPVLFGTAAGVSGNYHSAGLQLTPSSDLEGHTVKVQGTATKDEIAFAFRARLDLDLVVSGIAFEQQIDRSNGKVLIDVDLDAWLARADFSEVMTSSASAVVLEPGTQPHNALTRGINNTSAYTLSWIDP